MRHTVEMNITKELVKEAYEKTDIIPTRRSWNRVTEGKVCACGISAVALYVSGKATLDELKESYNWVTATEAISIVLGISTEDVWNFADGFDESEFAGDENSDFYKIGLEAGKMIFGE